MTVPDLVGALGRAGLGVASPDARLAAIRCLLARATAVIADREAVVAVLTEVAGGPADYLVRREAVRSLGLLKRRLPAWVAASARDLDYYLDVVRRTGAARRVCADRQRRGPSWELNLQQAPLTCLNFLQLAAQGFYGMGLRFHGRAGLRGAGRRSTGRWIGRAGLRDPRRDQPVAL